MNTNAHKITGRNRLGSQFGKASITAIFAVMVMYLAGASAHLLAATLTVTNTADSGAGTLRAALASAANGDTIDFALPTPAKITLTSGELLVSNSINILGPGAGNLSVDGNHSNRVFRISSNTVVTIAGVTITNGLALGPSIEDYRGAGILNDHATLTVSNCTLSGNSTSGPGGGILNDGEYGTATLTVISSTLSGNSAGPGGGIQNLADRGRASVLIINSTLSGNWGRNGGGAIYNSSRRGTASVQIVNSTLSGNSADYEGGSILNYSCCPGSSASLTIISSTLNGNSPSTIYNIGQSVFGQGSAPVTIGNTILNGGLFNLSGTITSLGYNLSSDNGGGFLTNATDQINTNPGLGLLRDNGGPTFTHALLCGSPAIDKGKRNLIPALASNTDQRGLPRPFDNPAIADAAGGDASDIGAFERQDSCAPCATTITVTSAEDSVPGSLREAILVANACPGKNIIEFAPSAYGRILLTSGELLITDDLCINGPGATNVTVDGNHASRAFHIRSNTIVTIAGLTITNGFVFSSSGGGIWNERATLTVNDCSLNGNEAEHYAGGIFNDHGTLVVSNSIISANSAHYIGGAIYNAGSFLNEAGQRIATNGASLKIINSIVRDCWFGAIYQFCLSGTASAQIVNCTLSNITFGRAIVSGALGPGSSVTIEILNSTLNRNSDGAILSYASSPNSTSQVQIVNSTLSGNYGNSIGNYAATASSNRASLRVLNCTITQDSGSGDACIDNTGSAEIGSTILNAGGSSSTLHAASSGVISLGYNLSSDDARGFLTNATDQTNTDPLLGPLQDNGGPTFTHALLGCSPAIDKGKNFTGSATEQRGLARSYDDPAMPNASGGDATDIGAFEAQAHVPDTTPPNMACADIGANETPGTGTLVVTFAPVVRDNCDPNPSVSCTPPSGSTFSIGTTIVTCAVTDASGNSNQCSFTVTICPITITVTTTNDDGPGSLRQAIADANACTGKNIIEFAPSAYGTILLTSGELSISDDLCINGPGLTNVAVDGNAASRVFFIEPSNTVTIAGLTITNGYDNGFFGGGIFNYYAMLTLSNCTVTGNSASYGGGIFNYLGSVVMERCVVIGNLATAGGGGGGIYNFAPEWDTSREAILTLSASMIVSNSALYGGGIYNDGAGGHATLTLSNCLLRSNSFGLGGAIFNSGGADLVAIATTFSENSAGTGGGIFNRNSTVQILNSTLSGNAAAGTGGGIINDGTGGNATTRLVNSTFTGNSAIQQGGGIHNLAGVPGGPSGTASVVIASCTFHNNSAPDGASIYNEGQALWIPTVEVGSTIFNTAAPGSNIGSVNVLTVSLGYNLSSDTAGGWLTNATDQINTDPLLGPLQDNGGPTFTHALLCGSPAIDKGKNFSGLTTDQRGLPRAFDRPQNANAPGGDGMDIGAFEVQQFCTPHLSHFGIISNQFGFNINAESNQLAIVEGSTNLTNWSALATNTVGGGPLRFNDADSASFSNRFYRARVQ